MASATLSPIKTTVQWVGKGESYRPDIDGLRAMAIICVVAFHARLAFFGGGFVGVDVFLVISGYLIGSLVYREVRDSRFTFLTFYGRRAKRILPALLTILCASNLIAYLILSPLELRKYCEESFAVVFSSSNIYYWLRSNYFNPVTAFRPLLMTWSLGLEEQFYLLFPIALYFLHKFAKRQMFYWVAAISVLSFITCIVCTSIYPSAAFYLLPMRVWELGLGILIAIREVQEGPMRINPAIADALACLGIALIAVPVLVYTEGTRFPGLAAALPVAGTACLLNARGSFINRRWLASPPMTLLGLVSYSWYLWHWPLLSFAAIVTGARLSVPRALFVALIALLLAALSYRFIEQPFRKSHSGPVRLFAGYGTVVALLGIISLTGYLQSGWPRRTPELSKVEETVRRVQANSCLADLQASLPRLSAPCVTQGTAPKVALLGDSHAAALGSTLRSLANGHGYGFELLTKEACPPLLTVTRRLALQPTFEKGCAAFNRTTLEHVLNDRSITVVVLAGFWSGPYVTGGRYLDTAHSGDIQSNGERFGILQTGLLKTISRLRSSGKLVFVATDVPRFDIDPMSVVRNSVLTTRRHLAGLLSSRVLTTEPVPDQQLIKQADTITDGEVRQAASEGGARILDLRRNLCPESVCSFWNHGTLLYSDTQHLTPAGAEYALRGLDPILGLH